MMRRSLFHRRSLQNTIGWLSRNLIGSWCRRTTSRQRIAVILNPASGPDRNVLKTINSTFQAGEIQWEVYVTHKSGDGRRLAHKALVDGADIVAAYGGDGTITEVASGLAGSPVPLGILPGGTTNMIATSLGIPRDLAQACKLLVGPDPTLRDLYLGQVNRRSFVQMVGVGLEASIVEGTDRSQKDRFGMLAYGLSAINVLGRAPLVRYLLELDGQTIQAEGVTCIVLNVDNINIPSLSKIPPWPRKGLLDVLLVTKADLLALISLAATVAGAGIDVNILSHWQARQISITADPPQPVQGDGDLIGETPIQVDAQTRTVSVIIPKVQDQAPPEIIVGPEEDSLPGTAGFIGRDNASPAGR